MKTAHAESEAIVVEDDEPGLHEASQDVQAGAAELKREKKFVIVYSRGRKFARLHRTDSTCFWGKHTVCDAVEIDSPVPEQYDARCKICWPGQTMLDSEDSDVYESDEEDAM